MTEHWLEEVGGRPAEPVKLTIPRHPGQCNHSDAHVCPFLNETVVDSAGYEHAVPCHCTPETAEFVRGN